MAFRVVQHEVKQNAVYIENLSKLSFLPACLHAFLFEKKNENQVWRFRSGLVSLSVLGTEVHTVRKKFAYGIFVKVSSSSASSETKCRLPCRSFKANSTRSNVMCSTFQTSKPEEICLVCGQIVETQLCSFSSARERIVAERRCRFTKTSTTFKRSAQFWTLRSCCVTSEAGIRIISWAALRNPVTVIAARCPTTGLAVVNASLWL